MIRLIAILLVMAWPATVAGQFTVSTSDAKSITTITSSISTQLATRDGTPIGEPAITQGRRNLACEAGQGDQSENQAMAHPSGGHHDRW